MTKFYLYNENIYRRRPDNHDFLLMTGWDKSKNRDRRIPEDQLNIDEMTKLKTSKALELINKYWDSVETTWLFNGRKYDNLCGISYNHPTHKFTHTYTNNDGKECSYSFEYYILWHQGHLYWAYAHTHYYPQMELMKFRDINTEPDINDFTKWTGVNHCRAVRDVKTGKFI